MRNNIADANPYFFPYNATLVKVFPYKWNDYGFELDGAIRIPNIYDGRDKFFFMVDDEWSKIRTIGQGSATIPSPAIASGNFAGFTTANGTPVTIYDPATGDANGFGKTALSRTTSFLPAESPHSPRVAEIRGHKHAAVLREWSKSSELFLQHQCSTGSPGTDCPRRLHPVAEVAVCLPLQFRQ